MATETILPDRMFGDYGLTARVLDRAGQVPTACTSENMRTAPVNRNNLGDIVIIMIMQLLSVMLDGNRLR